MSTSTTAIHPIATPLVLPCGVIVKNRLCKAALSESLASERTNRPNQQLITLYRRWAEGGIGACITGNVMIDRRYMEGPKNVALEANDAYDLSPYREWATTIKSKGALAIMQISHPGRQCPLSVNLYPIAPSAVPLRVPGIPAALSPARLARAMTADEIEDAITRYVKTAELAIACGFDGIQLHAAHGYLISQFLSPIANIRDDEWGGTSEKRRKFLITILNRLRATLPTNAIICIKLNSSDFQQGDTRNSGFDEQESMDVIRAIEGCKVDFIEISGGTYENAVMFTSSTRTSTREREAFFTEYTEKVRKTIPNVKMMLTGGFRSRAAMNHVIEKGDVELIGLGRPLIIQPNFANELLTSSAPDTTVRALDYNINITTGPKLLTHLINTLLQGLWHMAQLERLSYGLEPDIHISKMYILTIKFIKQYAFPPARIWNSSFRNGFIMGMIVMLFIGMCWMRLFQ